MAQKQTIRTKQDAKRITEEMARLNYAPLPRLVGSFSASGSTGTTSMQAYINEKLYSDHSNGDHRNRPSIPKVFTDGGGEVAVPDNIGTPKLGYISWGADNRLPNNVAALTELLPYMSASHKFNIDLVTGIGVEPVYHYTQYVGGNITEKEIPYESAGTLLKGMKLDLLRQLDQLDTEEQSSSSTSTFTAPASSSVAGNAIAAPAPEESTSDNPRSFRAALESRLTEIESDLATWEATQTEVADFFSRNNTLQTFLHLAADQTLLGMSFPEIDLQQTYTDPANGHEVKTFAWHPKAVAIRWRPALTCRLERIGKKSGFSEYVYVSNQWLNGTVFGATAPEGDYKMDAIRALNPSCPTEHLKSILRKTRHANVHREHRPTRFILPTRIASPLRPYYPVPPHYSVFAGRIYDYAFTMIDDRATAKQNARVIGYVIYVHNDYLLQLFKQNEADTKEKMDKVRDDLLSEINTFLNNRNNMGKPLMSIMFRDADGKTTEAWKIVEIENNNKSTVEANETELQEISSIIFFTWAVDARLIGNSPGDVTSSGGTDLRERYLLKQIQMSSTQQLLLRPYYVVRDINDWDTDHLRFRIKREVLTTLDNSKTGITTAETN